MEPLSLTFPFFLFFFSYGSLLIVFLKRRKLPASFLLATCHFLDFFPLLIYFSKYHLDIETYLQLTLGSPFYNFYIFFFFTWVHFWIQQSSNQYKKISRKIPKLAQLYPEYIIIFIIKILGYFWGVTRESYRSSKISRKSFEAGILLAYNTQRCDRPSQEMQNLPGARQNIAPPVRALNINHQPLALLAVGFGHIGTSAHW